MDPNENSRGIDFDANNTSSGSASPPSGTGSPAPNTSAGNGAGATATGNVTPDHEHHFGQSMLHGILSALGGSEDTHYSRDDNGNLVVSKTPRTPGQQWKRMIAGAIAGMGAGAGVSEGPGGKLRALSAGVGATIKEPQQRKEREIKQADEDFNARREAMKDKAQMAYLNQQMAESAFRLGRMGVDAAFQDVERETAFVKSIAQGGEHSQDLGVVARPADGDYFHELQRLHKDMPWLMKEQANGNIIGVPHVNKDGKIDGMHFALVTPEWKEAKMDHDDTIYHLVPPKKGEKMPRVEGETVKAGTMSNGDFQKARQASELEIAGWYKEQYTQEQENYRANLAQSGQTTRQQIRDAAKSIEDDKKLAKQSGNKDALTAFQRYEQAQKDLEAAYQKSGLLDRVASTLEGKKPPAVIAAEREVAEAQSVWNNFKGNLNAPRSDAAPLAGDFGAALQSNGTPYPDGHTGIWDDGKGQKFPVVVQNGRWVKKVTSGK